MTFPDGGLPGFSLLLQGGFLVRAEGCGSIRGFLMNTLGLGSELVEQLVQSVFLDGKPVDDLDSVNVRDGCTLALSAAMPGLVGATMRRGGYYASLRSGISFSQGDCREEPCCGDVRVKLFNLTATALERDLLQGGIRVQARELAEFLESRPPGFWAASTSIVADGQKIAPGELDIPRWGTDWVVFSVEISPDEGRPH
jgi:hypothetical protein